MSIIATCATIAAVLSSARGGENIELRGDCPQLSIERFFPKAVRINASKAKISGIIIRGGNVRFTGGLISAPGGAFANGPAGYAVNLQGSKNVSFHQTKFTAANRGIVIDKAQGVTITESDFVRLGQDGIIANASERVSVLRSRFSETIGKATECTVRKVVFFGLSRRDCSLKNGDWVDGFHPDAIQMRNGMKGVLIQGNLVEGKTQGLSQMDASGDAPLQRIRIEGNTIITDGPHKATLYTCNECFIRWNKMWRPNGSQWKAVIVPGAGVRCGNKTEQPEAAC